MAGFLIYTCKIYNMKIIRKNMLSLLAGLAILAVSLSGCYETHYYNHYHHHTRGWYERRHTPPPPGVNFELDVRH